MDDLVHDIADILVISLLHGCRHLTLLLGLSTGLADDVANQYFGLGDRDEWMLGVFIHNLEEEIVVPFLISALVDNEKWAEWHWRFGLTLHGCFELTLEDGPS